MFYCFIKSLDCSKLQACEHGKTVPDGCAELLGKECRERLQKLEEYVVASSAAEDASADGVQMSGCVAVASSCHRALPMYILKE